MNILRFEIKKYKADGMKILLCFLATVFLCAVIYFLSQEIYKRQSLFQPFVLGVVDKDQSMEINLLLGVFSAQVEMNKIISIEKMDEPQAIERLNKNEIAAYFIIPEKFTDDVKYGVNSPLTLVGNLEKPIAFEITKILSNAGISFLSASQSGIYATCDYAFENGYEYDFIDANILMPINLQFGKKLLDYKSFFDDKIISMSDHIPLAYYYLFSFVIFFMSINSMVFLNTLMESLNREFYYRYKLAGFSFLRIVSICFFPLFLLNSIFSIPLLYFFGAKTIFICLAVSGFTLLVATIFRNQLSASICLFASALVMLFVSGGIVPQVYLPPIIRNFKYLTISHWAIQLYTNPNSIFALLCFFAVFFLSSIFFYAKRVTK